MKRVRKGSFGYIKYQKTFSVLRTLLFFAVSLGLYALGYFSTGSNKNLLTIVAVLGTLPACKSLVNAVMFIRAAGCGNEAHERIALYDDKLTGFYDMYFTSYQTNYPISHMVLKGKTLCAYTESGRLDCAEGEKHIETLLKQDGYKNMSVKIFNNLDKYIDRLSQLEKLDVEEARDRDDMITMFYSVTL